MSQGKSKLPEILARLEEALARKPAPIRPQDFQVNVATSIKVIHGPCRSWGEHGQV